MAFRGSFKGFGGYAGRGTAYRIARRGMTVRAVQRGPKALGRRKTRQFAWRTFFRVWR